MQEKLISFLPDQFPNADMFFVELTGITYPDPKYHVERENSDIYCLEYVMEGKGTVHVNGLTFYPEKGDVYLLPVGSRHSYHSSFKNPWQKIWMNVRGSLCDQLFASYQLETIYHIKNCPLLPLFQKFVLLCDTPQPDRWVLESQCAVLFHQILAEIRNHLAFASQPSVSTASLVKEYIDQHLYEPLSVARLAEQACLSSSQLTRVFKKEYGQTPYDYLLGRKLDTACLLLRNTSLSVKEISYRLHFSDEHYFSNLFRKKRGCSPGQYRLSSHSANWLL